MRENHVIRWHSSSALASVFPPGQDAFGLSRHATPEDLNEAVGAYLMTPVDPVLQRNLMGALDTDPPKEWPRLAGGSPAGAPAGAGGPR